MSGRGRGYWRERDREFRERVAADRAEHARLDAIAERGRFIMEADEYTLLLIEQFGVTALRQQWAANRAADAKERQHAERQHARRTMADALALVAANPLPPSFRVVLYTEKRRFAYSDEEPPARRKRTLADLEKLGIAVEYVNPNAERGG